MHRVRDQRVIEAIHYVESMLPAKIHRFFQGVDYVVDTDPSFIGLHFNKATDDNRLYAETSHCVWPIHQLHLPTSQRKTTIVIQRDVLCYPEFLVDAILHELGHALDWALDFQRPLMAPINSYAADPYEAFAVAFRAWTNNTRENDGWLRQNREALASIDPRAVAFFDSLASPEHDVFTI